MAAITSRLPVTLDSPVCADAATWILFRSTFFVNKNNSLESIVIRLAGDSGDGIQLMGSQFAVSTALAGVDFATFPDYPAEIRAPVGTTFGVSAYQINLGSGPITTPGDAPDVLAAFNPAALRERTKSITDFIKGPSSWTVA
jgi:hypothetical protein